MLQSLKLCKAASLRSFTRCLLSKKQYCSRYPEGVSHQEHPFIFSEEGPFTEDEKEQYRRDGYVVVKGLLSPENVALYTNRFLDIANGKIEKEPSMLMMRDVSVAKEKRMGDLAITKLQDYMNEEVLSTYPRQPAMLKYAQQIAGPNLRAMHTMLINKPPDTGVGSSRHPPHQDLWYFTFRPINRIVCTWTALQPINREVGGLFCLPGTHIQPLQHHSYPTDGTVNRAYHGIQSMAEEQHEAGMVHLEMEPGDTAIFHPLLIHGSSRNLSTGTRKAISCHYAAGECRYVDVAGELQAPMVEEVVNMTLVQGAKRIAPLFERLGMEPTFENIWRAKSAMCSGEDVNLHKSFFEEKVLGKE